MHIGDISELGICLSSINIETFLVEIKNVTIDVSSEFHVSIENDIGVFNMFYFH